MPLSTIKTGGLALRQRFKETNQSYLPCFGDEAFRMGTSFGTLIGWMITGPLALTATRICETFYHLIAEKSEDWQCRRPKANSGQGGTILEPAYSLDCFLLGVTQSHASPHVTVICDVEWFSKSLRDIIVKSKLLLAYADWACFRLPFLVSAASPPRPGDLQRMDDFEVFIPGNDVPETLNGLVVEIWKGTSYFSKATIGGIVTLDGHNYALTAAHVFYPPNFRNHSLSTLTNLN